jgi:hypothetical protein
VFHDLADTDRIVVVSKQVENANAHWIGKGFEATRVLLCPSLSDPRRLYLGATIGGGAFGAYRHGVSTARVTYSSKNVNESWRAAGILYRVVDDDNPPVRSSRFEGRSGSHDRFVPVLPRSHLGDVVPFMTAHL